MVKYYKVDKVKRISRHNSVYKCVLYDNMSLSQIM